MLSNSEFSAKDTQSWLNFAIEVCCLLTVAQPKEAIRLWKGSAEMRIYYSSNNTELRVKQECTRQDERRKKLFFITSERDSRGGSMSRGGGAA